MRNRILSRIKRVERPTRIARPTYRHRVMADYGNYDEENFDENYTEDNWDFLTQDFPAARDSNIRKGIEDIMEAERNPKMRNDIIDLCKYAYDNGFSGQYFDWFVQLMIKYCHADNAVKKGRITVDCWKDFLGEIPDDKTFIDLTYATQSSLQKALGHADGDLSKDFMTPGKEGDDIREMVLEIGREIGTYDVSRMVDYFMVYLEANNMQTAIDLANWKKANGVSSASFVRNVWRDVRRAFVRTNEDMNYMSFLVMCGKKLKENEVDKITTAYLNNEFDLQTATQIVQNGVTKSRKSNKTIKYDIYSAITGTDYTVTTASHRMIMRRWAKQHTKTLKKAMVLTAMAKKMRIR